MTYGAPSPESEIALRKAGYDLSRLEVDEEAPTAMISTIIDGALDEEFYTPIEDAYKVGTIIADSIEIEGGHGTYEVMATDHNGDCMWRHGTY